jgi:pyridoxal biosynthesis lyase PdxS
MKQFTSAFPQQKSDISGLIPKMLKSGVIVDVKNTPQAEFDALTQAISFLKQQHGENVTFVVELADKSNHPKAGQAMPNKPAIVVE